jgi:hypothetical protein
MADRTLTLRELNRATLARQLLLERHDLAVPEALGRVAGLQAQAPGPPFVGLWTRLRDFDPDELRGLIARREVVRATMMRHTVHLVTTADYLRLRGPIQPALERMFGGITRTRVGERDLAAVVQAAQERFAQRPHTFAEIRKVIAELLPDADHSALAYGVRTHISLIAQPTDGRWSFGGTAPYALAEQWLGTPIPSDTDPAELILRYLAGFGPGTVADVQAWSGLAGLRPAVERLRPRLLTFRDGRGRELFDVPGAPLPEADTPAPARFLPDYDNTILSHADRTRVVADEHRPRIIKGARVRATFLLDGFVSGMWSIERRRSAATLIVEPFRKMTRAERAALAAEAEPLVRFVEPDAAAWELTFEDPA